MRTVARALALAVLALPAAAATASPTDVGYFDPVWSPDGKQIAFVDRNGIPPVPGDLLVMNADGTDVRRLTHGTRNFDENQYGARNPDWSPDGRTIAFAFGYDKIHLIATDGSSPHVLTTGDLPAWSPRGRKIAFTQFDDTGPSTVHVINPDGSHRTLVAAPKNIYLSYGGSTWSPDGKRLAFSIGAAPDSDGEVPTALGVISQYRGRVRLLHTGSHRATQADWSPDGRRLLFTDNLRGIIVLDLRTHRFKKIFTRLGSVFHPRWSPDGRQIAFSWRSDIWVVGADGTGLRRVIG